MSTRDGGLPTICFVTYELAPISPGGCGAYITRMIPELADHLRVLVLAAMPASDVDEYRRRGLHDPCGTGVNEVYCLNQVVPPSPADAQNEHVRNTQRFAEALARLCNDQRIDLIEIPEYAGMAYGTVKLKRQRSWFVDQRVIVRLHGSIELIDYHERSAACTLQRRMIYMMERYVLRNADILVAPTAGTLGEYSRFYNLEREAMISPPPVTACTPTRGAGAGSKVLCVGRVQAIKGVDLFVRAGVSWLEQGAPEEIRFQVVGSDLVPGHEDYRTYVDALIPRHAREHFEFLGHRDPAEIPELARQARFAVVPSRWESFCYVARELLALGLPVITSPIEAFRGLEGISGVESFDGSSDDLTRVMVRQWGAPSLTTAPCLPSPVLRHGDQYAELAARENLRRPPATSPGELGVGVLEGDAVPWRETVSGIRVWPREQWLDGGPHKALTEWLREESARYLAVVLADWDGDVRALQVSADYLSRHAEVAAVECLPRYVAPGLEADPQATLLALSEADELVRKLFGLVPTGLVFRRPSRVLEFLPGSVRDVMGQLISVLAAEGDVEILWPTDGHERRALLFREVKRTGEVTGLPGGATERWALGYLRRRAAEKLPPAVLTGGPGYWVSRSWQVLRDEGTRAYVRKLVHTAAQRVGRPRFIRRNREAGP